VWPEGGLECGHGPALDDERQPAQVLQRLGDLLSRQREVVGDQPGQVSPVRAVPGVAGRPIAAARLEGPKGSWLAVFPERLAVVMDGQVEDRRWHEFEAAAWTDATRTLSASFVDDRVAPLHLVVAEGEDERIALVVRERIEHSIVFQEHADLPSGLSARGLVRRDADGSLFTQIVIDGQPDARDEADLDRLDASIRDVVGMPPADRDGL